MVSRSIRTRSGGVRGGVKNVAGLDRGLGSGRGSSLILPIETSTCGTGPGPRGIIAVLRSWLTVCLNFAIW